MNEPFAKDGDSATPLSRDATNVIMSATKEDKACEKNDPHRLGPGHRFLALGMRLE